MEPVAFSVLSSAVFLNIIKSDFSFLNFKQKDNILMIARKEGAWEAGWKCEEFKKYKSVVTKGNVEIK